MADYFKKSVSILLKDRTTGKNIIWATSDYEGCASTDEITSDTSKIITTHNSKSIERKKFRVRSRAEVFTPAWICNEQNNLIDEIFFGRANVFNTVDKKNPHVWKATTEKIFFDGKKTWQDYVKATRLEITCGEAPYLVSRYDVTTGAEIKIEDRIGLLDRKFRVIHENVFDKADWLKWAKAAVKSVYGYEFQGDNLFLARKNIFESVVEYYQREFGKEEPPENFFTVIAEIISWNLFQMNGIKCCVPFVQREAEQQNLPGFGEKILEDTPCKIKDWQTLEVVEFRNIGSSRR